MDFKELLDACKAQALSSKLYPTDDAVWRFICRSYSKKFNTALMDVMALDVEHVLLTHFEDQLDMADLESEDDLNDIIASIGRIEDPDFDEQEEEQVQGFMERMEAREEKKKSIKNKIPDNDEPEMYKEPEVSKMPLSGGIDLSYLAKLDSEG